LQAGRDEDVLSRQVGDIFLFAHRGKARPVGAEPAGRQHRLPDVDNLDRHPALILLTAGVVAYRRWRGRPAADGYAATLTPDSEAAQLTALGVGR
jgi:hypothetical protein